MSEPALPPSGPSPSPKASGAPGPSGGPQSSGDVQRAGRDDPEGGAVFRALFERLEAKARELETKSKALEDPAALAGAVDAARASLDDALSLGDRLLEAYREAQLSRGPGPAPASPATALGRDAAGDDALARGDQEQR